MPGPHGEGGPSHGRAARDQLLAPAHARCVLCVVQASLVSVRASIREPFEIVQKRTVEVQNLQAAGEILRAVVRVRELSEKLERHLAQGEGRNGGLRIVSRRWKVRETLKVLIIGRAGMHVWVFGFMGFGFTFSYL